MSMQHFLSWNQEDHEGFDTEIIGSKRRPRWTATQPPAPVASAAASDETGNPAPASPTPGESIPQHRAVTPKAEDVRPVQFRNHLAHTSKLSF